MSELQDAQTRVLKFTFELLDKKANFKWFAISFKIPEIIVVKYTQTHDAMEWENFVSDARVECDRDDELKFAFESMKLVQYHFENALEKHDRIYQKEMKNREEHARNYRGKLKSCHFAMDAINVEIARLKHAVDEGVREIYTYMGAKNLSQKQRDIVTNCILENFRMFTDGERSCFEPILCSDLCVRLISMNAKSNILRERQTSLAVANEQREALAIRMYMEPTEYRNSLRRRKR